MLVTCVALEARWYRFPSSNAVQLDRSLTASNFIDGSTGSFCNSKSGEAYNWLEVDLGGKKVLSSVVVYNRNDPGFYFRIVGGTIGWYSRSMGEGTQCASWTFETSSLMYTFSYDAPPSTATTPIPTLGPTNDPTHRPVPLPTLFPTVYPSPGPSAAPTAAPTVRHTNRAAHVRHSYATQVAHGFHVLPPAKFFRVHLLSQGGATGSTLTLSEVVAFGRQSEYPGWKEVLGWDVSTMSSMGGSAVKVITVAEMAGLISDEFNMYDYCVAQCSAIKACKSITFEAYWWRQGCILRSGCVDESDAAFPDTAEEMAELQDDQYFDQIRTWYRDEDQCEPGVISSPSKVPVPAPSYSPSPTVPPSVSTAPSTSPAPSIPPSVSAAPTAVPPCRVELHGQSAGLGQGVTQLTLLEGRERNMVNLGFDNSFVGRGINVVTLDASMYGVLATETYDTYGCKPRANHLVKESTLPY